MKINKLKVGDKVYVFGNPDNPFRYCNGRVTEIKPTSGKIELIRIEFVREVEVELWPGSKQSFRSYVFNSDALKKRDDR